MNYLAHLLLSGEDKEVMIGNYLGDSIKGSHYNDFSEGIKKGILLHRFIDDFTDHHPSVHEAKSFFVKEFDKYSGVLIDVFFDHFLAKNFHLFSKISLEKFSEDVRDILHDMQDSLTDNATLFLEYMTKNKIPEGYKDLEKIEMVLQGMTMRIHHRFDLTKAMRILNEFYEELEKIFLDFFPVLQARVKDYRF